MDNQLFCDFLLNKNQMCRCCLSKKNLRSIFEPSTSTNTLVLSELYCMVTSLPITDDDAYPTQICDDCTTHLLETFTFRDRCRQAIEKFERLLKQNYDVNPELEITLHTNNSFDVKSNDSEQSLKIETQSRDDMKMDKKRFKCNVCHRGFARKSTYQKHFRNAHPSKRMKYKCDVCEMRFISQPSLIRHSYVHNVDKLFKCSVCGEMFQTGYKFRSHVNKVHANVEPTPTAVQLTRENGHLKCGVCHKTFTTKSNCLRHFYTRHKRDQTKTYPCERCDKFYQFESTLARHVAMNHPDDNKSSDNEDAEIHGKSENDEKYNDEMNIDLIKSIESLNDDDEAVSKPTNNIACDLCSSVFTTRAGYVRHYRVRHKARNWTHTCDDCGRRFETEACLIKHNRVHRTTYYECDACSEVFSTRAQSKDHVEQAHAGEKKPKMLQVNGNDEKHHCQTCDKTFANRSSLTQHNVIHGAKKFLCTDCGMSFHTKTNLVRHTSKHTGVKNFQCKLCDRSFLYRTSLVAHMPSHSGERAHECEICHKRFAHRSGMLAHVRNHAGRRFPCVVCNKMFTQIHNMRVHMKSHGENTCFCSVCLKGFYDMGMLRKHEKMHLKKDAHAL